METSSLIAENTIPEFDCSETTVGSLVIAVTSGIEIPEKLRILLQTSRVRTTGLDELSSETATIDCWIKRLWDFCDIKCPTSS